MTDPTAQEPTMEEILASIRRIISEDDAPAETAAAPEQEPEGVLAPESEPEPAPFPEASPALIDETPSVQEAAAVEDDVLELTDRYDAPESESIGDLDVSTAGAASIPTDYDALVGESASASAASAFAGLHASLQKPEPAVSAPAGPDINFVSGSTVEGMVAEMLKPMLKGWLDANLPGIVQKAVKAEVERIARNAG